MSWMWLTGACGKGEFACPHCQEELDVETWTTEYGEPLAGEFDVHCPFCNKEFLVSVTKSTSYRVV